MLFIAVFVGVTLGSMGSALVVTRYIQREREAVRLRISREFQAQTSALVAPLYKNSQSLALLTGEGEIHLADALPVKRHNRRSVWQKFDQFLKEARIAISPAQLLAIATAMGISLGIVGAFLGGWPVAVVCSIAGFAIPFGSAFVKRNLLRERLLQQLPNAFDLMARVLRTGQSIPQAMQSVSEAFDDPLGPEFARCQQQQQFGLRPEVVFRDMALRSGIMELRIFVIAMIVQRQVGGNLSEVLDRLGNMVRARLRLRQQIRSLTAEGRLQGWTLVALPIVMLFAMHFVNRQYAQELFAHKGLLVATGASMITGILWIRRIVNFQD